MDFNFTGCELDAVGKAAWEQRKNKRPGSAGKTEEEKEASLGVIDNETQPRSILRSLRVPVLRFSLTPTPKSQFLYPTLNSSPEYSLYSRMTRWISRRPNGCS